MSRLKLLTGAAIAALMGVSGAKAADMPVYYEQPIAFGGWYLRGDVGVSHQRVDRVDNSIYYDPGIVSWASFGDDFEASWFVGLGVGYQFNEWFRADITGEYRAASDYHGIHAFDNDLDPADYDLIDDYTGEKTEWTFLLNGYWDFYTWEKVTFFAGAGVGASYNKIGEIVDIDVNNPDFGGGPNCAVGNGCAPSNGKWQFAWALHAGMAFAVAPNIAVEIAYRYLNLGDAESGNLTGNTGVDTTVNPMRFEDLDSHDVKVGVRYTFN